MRRQQAQIILVLGGVAQDSKTGVAKTKFAVGAMDKFGKASNELFMQFVTRVALEIPTATLAMFSKLKYINSQTLDTFRGAWNAKYLNGFVVHSKAFDGLKGDFPIGFLIGLQIKMLSKGKKLPKLLLRY